MKIIEFRHRVVSVPVKYPVVSSVRDSSHIVFVLLDVLTDEGIKGISYVQAFHTQGAKAIIACLDFLEDILKGEDARGIKKIWYKMWDATKLFGHQGISTFALSLVDIALWDILGKSTNLPVYQLLGGQSQSFHVYQSDGLWLTSPVEAARQAESFVTSGFNAVKMRLGRKRTDEDLKAVVEVRRAIGENVELLCDVNQGWTIEKTEEMGKKLLHSKIDWLEEPIPAEDLEEYTYLSNSLEIQIASGENLYGIRPFHRFLQNNASSVYTPDLQRVGGITGWKRINVMMELYNKPSTLHLFPEYAVHLLPVVKKAEKMEWISWASVLFKEPLQCKDGKVQTPSGAGFCLEWDENAIKKFQIT